MKLIKLKLFSPVIIKGEAPYENPWDGGEDFRILTEPEKKKCRNEINEVINEAFETILLPVTFERKIYSTFASAEEKDGRLMLSLSCECYRHLSENETDELCGWWENLVVETSELLCKRQIKTRKLGKIIIYLWFMKGWAIEPVITSMEGV